MRPYAQVGTLENGSEDEFEQPQGSCKTLRVAVLVVPAVALIAVIICAAAASPARSELGSFQEKLSIVGPAPVPPGIKPKPGLCNVGIVLDFCLRVNAKQPSYLGGNPKSPLASVSAATLSSMLSVSVSSVIGFLKAIGTPNTGSMMDGYEVRCEELCEKTIASFGAGELPGQSNVGCWYKTGVKAGLAAAGTSASPVCDVDVSLPVLGKAALPSPGSIKGVSNFLLFRDASIEELKFSVARLFRVFPGSMKSRTAFQVLSSKKAHAAGSLKKKKAHAATNISGTFQRKLAMGVADDSCEYSNDNQCDEPRYCSRGTDCSDCAKCGATVPLPNKSLPIKTFFADEVLQAGAKVQSLLAWALIAIQSGKGAYDAAKRTALKKEIALASLELDDVTYEYPAKEACKFSTGAYMDGKAMRLCPDFFDGPLDSLYVQLLKTVMGDAAGDIASFVKTYL